MVKRYNVTDFVEDPEGIAVAYADYAELEEQKRQDDLVQLLKERFPSMIPITLALPQLGRPVIGVNIEGKMGIYARGGSDEQWEWKTQTNPTDLLNPASVITSPVQDIFGWAYLPGFEQ